MAFEALLRKGVPCSLQYVWSVGKAARKNSLGAAEDFCKVNFCEVYFSKLLNFCSTFSILGAIITWQ